ncbi:3-chlorobenzoate-3,4-dioxygenase reductase subunit [Trematosphaeria pertusa]|uniref:3-chlorobenzoate-3,4-dioxygenase reductase subunit n=1 Tax=Trematosphaeria pertusa TaxID=390896 RepID=A0A6A6IJE0_9PLEO|nr:3-chlorobenzoate-3,4-dioxygenase reductase subunit [Trematosphaeria pertusa]KAF2250339.1 3-chlorobenzoate-3,4-dioxygenase reductase subunit [Trematosphaeria pertusa]
MTSAIYKTPLSGPVEITKAGISTDEHAYEPHRSPDKAIHQYSSAHYPVWAAEIPESAHLFRPGAFGENLFTDELDERKLCIGDKVAIGEVVLEVSEPRSPCYKLNHRFQVKNMANRTQTLLRCGWLYRVLEPGHVNAGDMIRLLERPSPEWTVARIMYYMFLEKGNIDMMKEIVALPALGEEIRRTFRKRLDKGMAEDSNGRMYGDETVNFDTWKEYCIAEKRRETGKITTFVLEAVEEMKEDDVVPVEPGSHVRVKLGGKLVRAYSVVGGTSKRFELGIALEPESRGGSKYMHEQTQPGDVLTFGRITASFPLAKDADKHIIIAGGIGITAFLAALKHLRTTQQIYELHFAVADEVPFKQHIAVLGANAKIYKKSQGQRLNLTDVFARADTNTHIYCCGPQRLQDAVASTAKEYGVPDSSVRFEQFTVTTSGDPFTAELKRSGKTVEVGPTQTLLDALREVGMDIDSSCEVGNCGTCRVEVCGGRVEHKGTGLLEEEKAEAMLSCVSRGIGRIINEETGSCSRFNEIDFRVSTQPSMYSYIQTLLCSRKSGPTTQTPCQCILKLAPRRHIQ